MSAEEHSQSAVPSPSHDGLALADTPRVIPWTCHKVLRWNTLRQTSGRHILRTQEELAALWASQEGDPKQAPVVDFSRHMAICIFVDPGPQRETPVIDRIQQEGRELVVHIARSGDGWEVINSIVAVLIPRFDGPCRFASEEETRKMRQILLSDPDFDPKSGWQNTLWCLDCGQRYNTYPRTLHIGPILDEVITGESAYGPGIVAYNTERLYKGRIHQVYCPFCALRVEVAESLAPCSLHGYIRNIQERSGDLHLDRILHLKGARGSKPFPVNCPRCDRVISGENMQNRCRHCQGNQLQVIDSRPLFGF